MAKKTAARRGRGTGPNMSAFIREVFAANPNAKVADANKAWSEAGHKGAITNSLFYLTKSKAGLASKRGGKKRGRPAGSKNKTADGSTAAASPVKPAKGYAAVESHLDEIVFLLTGLGDADLAGEIRVARRRVSAKLL